MFEIDVKSTHHQNLRFQPGYTTQICSIGKRKVIRNAFKASLRGFHIR